MKIEELKNSKHYHHAGMKLDIYNAFKSHLEKHPDDATKIPKWYLARILNGNFNGSLGKLIELSLLIKKIPVLKFDDLK